jgi:hypothetical protein
MRSLRWVLAVMVLGGVATLSAQTRTASYQFAGRRFTLQLPSEYRVATQASPDPTLTSFGFTTEPRGDGSRGMIQVTLINFQRGGRGATVTLSQFADRMIDGIRKSRTQWAHRESVQEIGGVPARRFDWSGSVEFPNGEATPYVQGIMIVGIKEGIGFALNTQDLAVVAPRTMPACEKALKSFRLLPRK